VNPIIIAAIIIVIVALIAAGALSPTFTKKTVSELVEPVVETIGESNDEPFEESFDESFEESFVESQVEPSQDCSGTARCITGFVTKIVDGDTIHVDGVSVRFALSSAPELKGFGGIDSRNFIDTICPVGSDVIVDEDDSQTEGSFGRIIGVVYCNGVNLNSELLDAGLGYLADQFCDSSEFANDSWAIKHGC
jgi:micrococcal nuclease